jgi:hypothetical protein
VEDLKMKVPEGYIIDKEVSTVDRVVLKKTDVFPYDKVSGCFVDNMSQVRCIAGESREEHNENVFATQKQASGAIALARLSQHLKVALGEWTPSWNTGEECFLINIGTEVEPDSKGRLVHHLCVSYYHYRPALLLFPNKHKAQLFLMSYNGLIKEACPLLFGIEIE